ncbi:hypothetical protein BS639_16990 [Rouxiella silvae]|uniref:Uncharacterized protein n=1 Tax=Rouxiella silvae TaxID=1646373 RepID=A0ABX3TXT9_9GAMM|nr:hypothetical protein [Rouxiella silvae]ORJ19990.1 hypothetical protein BS639_16990 [Rouxiella silvae]
MTVYVCVFEPNKKAVKAGAIPLAIAIEANSLKGAKGKAIMMLDDAYPAATDNFNEPKVTEDAHGSNRPALDKFDERFAIDNEYVDGIWRSVVIAQADEESQDVGPFDVAKLSLKEKIAAVIFFEQDEIEGSDYSMICDALADDESDIQFRTIVEALSQIKALEQMYPASMRELIQAIYAKYNPVLSVSKVLAFAQHWVNKPTERPAPASTPARTLQEIDMDIAMALCGVDIASPSPALVNQAREMLRENEDKSFRAFSGSIRAVDGVTCHSREVIVGLVQELCKRKPLNTVNNLERSHVIATYLSNLGAKPPEAEVTVQNLGNGAFSIEGLTGEKASENKPLIEKQQQEGKPEVAAAAVVIEQASTAKEVEKQLVQVQEAAPAAIENLDKEIEKLPVDAQKNLSIWRSVQKTDEKFTKAFSNNGGGTSINGTYMMMRATEIFGPIGKGWGYNIDEERFDKGAPITEKITDDSGKPAGSRIVRDADGNAVCELNHTVLIDFWYRLDGEKCHIQSYGCTEYLYNTKYGLTTDGEAPKKSLTDAVKKALSLLGFSADVFLGLYDDQAYRNEVKQEFALKNASDKAEDIATARTEFDEKLSKNATSIEKAVTTNEAEKIFKTVAREIDIHRKDAEAKGDPERAKYLAGRLRRLSEIKTARINQLQGETA